MKKRDGNAQNNRLLRLRQKMNQKRPKFLHQEHWKLKRFKKASWRRPKGKRSKMRAKERAKPYLVSIGYRGPKKVRGLHPKGAPEILVHTVQDVERIEEEREKEKEGIKKEEGKEIKREEGKRKGKKGKKGKKGIKPDCVIKIASTVGTRKKAEIVRAAVEKNMYVANPSVAFAKVCSTEELEHLLPIKQYIKAWFISDKLTDDEREEVEARAEEEGIEVME